MSYARLRVLSQTLENENAKLGFCQEEIQGDSLKSSPEDSHRRVKR